MTPISSSFGLTDVVSSGNCLLTIINYLNMHLSCPIIMIGFSSFFSLALRYPPNSILLSFFSHCQYFEKWYQNICRHYSYQFQGFPLPHHPLLLLLSGSSNRSVFHHYNSH